MKKITLDNYEQENIIAINNYTSKQYGILNEYFYIQDPMVIDNLIDRITQLKNDKQSEAHFLSGFFWNQKTDNYAIAENIGKFFLRLSSFKDENTLIEVKELSLEEKINFFHNINKIIDYNNYLGTMFSLNGKRFSEKIVELLEDKDIIEKIKTLYCADWIDENDMFYTIRKEIIFLKNIELNVKLNNKFTERKSIRKNKI